MAWRSAGTPLLEAERHFHRIKGYRQIATFIQALSKVLVRMAAGAGLGILWSDSPKANWPVLFAFQRFSGRGFIALLILKWGYYCHMYV